MLLLYAVKLETARSLETVFCFIFLDLLGDPGKKTQAPYTIVRVPVFVHLYNTDLIRPHPLQGSRTLDLPAHPVLVLIFFPLGQEKHTTTTLHENMKTLRSTITANTVPVRQST